MLVSKNQLLRETNQTASDTNTPLIIQSEGFDFAVPVDKGLESNNTLGASIESSEHFKIVTEPVITPVPVVTEQENEKRKEIRKEMITSKTAEPVDFAYERAIGNNDSLYSNFIELIAINKRKVARIVIKENDKKVGYATGFMVSKNLMLTNWHVFQTREMATTSEAHFFYEYDNLGYPLTPIIFKLDSSKFYNNKELDYCFVGIAPIDVTNKFPIKDIGYLYLDKAIGKVGEVNVEKLNIIHHPLGDYKQISIRENLFVGIDDTKIYYDTDTAQGSSGSAVFNDQWQVVGLHHKSIAKMTADGKYYLDKEDNIIPEYDGKIDITKVVWLKNEGIRISALLNHVRKKNPNDPIIAEIDQLPSPENLKFIINENLKEVDTMETNNNKNIIISVSVDALNSEKTIDISLSSKNTQAIVVSDNHTISGPSNELLLEAARISKEDAVDFSSCRGYLTDFLGKEVPMPQPSNNIKKEIALLRDKTMELKYFNYSLIFNAVRRMPLISAVNVSGDPTLRIDDSERSDDWLRDVRIDKSCQLDDKFYTHSNFDRGHMSRYQDAKWTFPASKTNELRNGIYTCFYSNACPQVPGLNRAPGIWGKLEKAVLEKGIKKQTESDEIKMTVFNGPIFNKDTDKIFKGVRIPMEFFKIIVWLDDAKKLRATAFKLSQILLLKDIHFDESMRIDEEALDIDKVVEFKSFQCSIENISKATEIDFKGLEKYDTFKGDDSLLDDDESIIV